MDDEFIPDPFLRYTKESEQSHDVSGWLLKEGKKLKQHKPRFLRLRDSLLSNHRDPNADATWTIPVSNSSVLPGSRQYELVINLPRRKVCFFAENAAEYEKWIVALKKATTSHKTIDAFYKMGDIIGEGVNGEVVRGWDRATGDVVAIKSIPYEGDIMEKEDPAAEKEIQIVKALNHPHLVKTYDVFRSQKKRKIYIVMEYVSGGELHARIANEGNGSLIKEGDAIRVARNILSAVEYLHDQDIVHRDIKLENVLCVDEDREKPVQVKLADFGLSQKLSGKNPLLSSMVGTGFYFAPEIIRKQGYGSSVDMWACGVLFYITLSGQLPFFGDDVEEYYEHVVNQPLEFPETEWGHVSDNAKEFIRGLLEKDVEKRMSVKQALRHSWVLDADILSVEPEKGEDESSEDDAPPRTIFRRLRKSRADMFAKVKKTTSENANIT